MKCINKNHPDYKALKASTGMSDLELQLFINKYQETNGEDSFPPFSSPEKIVDDLQLEAEQYAEYTADKLRVAESRVTKDLFTGEYTIDNKPRLSVTKLIEKEFIERKLSEETIGQIKAKQVFKGRDPLEKIQILDANKYDTMNMEEYAAYIDNQIKKDIVKGEIFHAITHKYFTPEDTQIGNVIATLQHTYGISDGEIEWINPKNIKKIIKSRINTDYWKDNAVDKFHTEYIVESEELGLAGRIDALIDHGDKIFSIIDFKTGKSFDKEFNHLLRFGNTTYQDIWDNPRNRAKLQVMLYAVILKSKDPSIKFRDLKIIHTISEGKMYKDSAKNNIQAGPYLEMIEAFIRTTKPEVYQKLDKRIFQASEYNSVNKMEFGFNGNPNPEEMLKYKIAKLQSLVLADKNVLATAESKDKKVAGRARDLKLEISKVIEEIVKLKGDPSIDFTAITDDMGWLDSFIGSPSASTNPYIQVYYKFVTEQKQKARDEYVTWRAEFDKLLAKLSEEKGGIGQNWIGGKNRLELFSFAIKKTQVGAYTQHRLFTKEDPEYKNNMTKTEQAFIDFFNKSVGQFFVDDLSTFVDPETKKKKALANRIVTYSTTRSGKEISLTNLDLHKRQLQEQTRNPKEAGFQYYEGLLPKVPQLVEDIRERFGLVSPQMKQHLWYKYFTNYFEDQYDGWFNQEEAIPMKFLGNQEIDLLENYSLNLEHVLDSFVKQYYYKQHADDAYALGQGFKIYLNAKQDPSNNITYKNLIGFFEASVDMHILGKREVRDDYFSRALGVKTPSGSKSFSITKFLRSLKNFFYAPTMWLKPLTGLPNFVFASLVNIKEAVKGDLFNGKSHAGFTTKDLAYGYSYALKLLGEKAMINPTHRQDPVWLLLEKTGFMPDSYDWFTSPNELFTRKNRLFRSKTLTAFHTYPEEVTAVAIFVAQLRAMKTKNKEGQTITMLEAYQAKENLTATGDKFYTLEYTGAERGKVNVSNIAGEPVYVSLTELTTDEINSMKYLYEKIHGGYRQDERVRLEYYILGELMLQLKRYIPSILKNAFASKGRRYTQGYYRTNEDGTLKWEPQVIEGRWRLMAGVILNYAGARAGKNGDKGNRLMQLLGYQKDETYDWDSLSDAQKEDVIDFVLTWVSFIGLSVGGKLAWDRDDKDTIKKIYERVTNDFASNVLPLEMIHNIVNLGQPIALTKSLKTLTSLSELSFSVLMDITGNDDQALTLQGNYRGWKEFQRNIPFISAAHDWQKGLKESDYLQEILDYKVK